MSTYQEKPAPRHNQIHLWMSNDRNKYRVINRVLLNLGLAGELKILDYEAERPVRRSPTDFIRGYIDGLITISLKDDQDKKHYFLLLGEYKPQIENAESVLRQVQYYQDLLVREPLIKEMDIAVLRVLLTLDPNDAWDKEFRAKEIHVFRAIRSLDELFWDSTEPKVYEEPWRRHMREWESLRQAVDELKETLSQGEIRINRQYEKMGLYTRTLDDYR